MVARQDIQTQPEAKLNPEYRLTFEGQTSTKSHTGLWDGEPNIWQADVAELAQQWNAALVLLLQFNLCSPFYQLDDFGVRSARGLSVHFVEAFRPPVVWPVCIHAEQIDFKS